MTSIRAFVFAHWWWLVVAFVLIWGAKSRWDDRPPVSFSEPPSSTFIAAATGDVGSLEFGLTKLRDECWLKPETAHLILVDRANAAFSINQRSGIEVIQSAEFARRTIRFEVPRFALPGQASVYLTGVFLCENNRVRVVSPKYRYEVLEVE